MKFHFGEKKATRLTNCMAKIFPDVNFFAIQKQFFRIGKNIGVLERGKIIRKLEF